MPDRKFVTALYGRTSKDDPRRVTIEIQKHTLHDWAARDPLVENIIDEYWDDGVTGKLPLAQRPQGKRLLADITAGRIKSVAVAYADRFGRTLLDGLQAVKLLEDQGVKLVAVNDGWDARRNDSPLYFQFRMMMAEEEHRRISQRMRDGKLRAMDRDNAPPGGPLVFGYRSDGQGRFVPDPVEAPVVIRLFEMAASGESHVAMLAWASSQGAQAGRKFQKRVAGSEPSVVRTHREAVWHLTKINKILSNPVYLGWRTWGGRTFPCVPLVDPATFEVVQGYLADKARRNGKKGDPEKSFLSGLLACGRCGRPYYHKPTVCRRKNGTVDRYFMYICDSLRRPDGGCKSKMIRVDDLDPRVWALVEELLANPVALVRKMVMADEKLGGVVAELDAAETAHAATLLAIDAEVETVWAEQRKNGWPVAWVTPRLNELNQRRETTRALLADVRRRRATVVIDREESSAVTAYLAGVRAALAAGVTAAKKYDIIRLLVAGGVVETRGQGRHKEAAVTLRLRWGEKLVSPGLPKDWSFGSQGVTTLPVTICCGRCT